MDWSLFGCARKGHVTYAPDEPDLRDRLMAPTAGGTAWRCLRCGAFVHHGPHGKGQYGKVQHGKVQHGSGPAANAPVLLRGAALRSAFILRLLAVERFIRGLLLLALSYGIHRFNGARDSLQRFFDTYLPTLRPLADRLGIDLQSTGPVRLIDKALHTGHATLTWVSIGVLAYGCLQLLEGIGLWLLKRWGEYVAVVGTSLFIPLEVYELLEKVTWLRVVAFAVNIFAVVYLVWTKRLFGLRGGHAAFEAERHGASLLEVESAAVTAP